MESVPAKFSSNDEKLNSYFIALEQLNELSDLAIVEYNKTKNVNSYYTFYYNGLNKLLKENNYSRTRMLVMQKLIEIAYATGKDIDKTMIKSHLELIGPYSVYWEKSVSLVIPALELLGEKKYKEDFIDKMISKNPSHSIRQGILYNLISFYFEKQDKENGIKYYNILINTYPDAKITKSAKKEFSPDRKMIVGKALPDFSYENIDKPGDMITNKTFSGKLCFIDIWATWCGPCVGEMEHLHNVYNKFKNKNFAMYSISIDANKEDIGKFRQGKWKMPWLHSFSDGIWKSKVVELFEVSGVPQPMLISPDGIILEMGVSLRGEDLESTIEKYLKK
jgi:thiol-disulfide isomerase/thioredoxin